MRVISKGRTQSGWSKQYVCTGFGNGGGGCGAKLLVSETDLYKTSRTYIDGSSDHYTTFCCCECGVETDTSDDPPHVRGSQPSRKEREEIMRKNRVRSEDE